MSTANKEKDKIMRGSFKKKYCFESIDEPGVEPLDIEKLIKAKELTNKSRDYDSSYIALKEDLTKPKEEDVPVENTADSDETSDTEDTGDEGNDDSSESEPSDDSGDGGDNEDPPSEEPNEDTDKDDKDNKETEDKSDDKKEDEGDKEEKPEKSDVDDKDDKAKPSKESLRNGARVNLTLEECYRISYEDDEDNHARHGGVLYRLNNHYKTGDNYIDDQNANHSVAHQVASSVGEGVGALATLGWYGTKELASLGVKYGPGLAKKGWKIVSGITGGLFHGIGSIANWTKRKFNSIESLKEDLEELLKTIEEIESKNEEQGKQKFTETKHIDVLKTSNNVELMEQLSKVKSFLNDTIQSLNKEIHEELVKLSSHIASDVRNDEAVNDVLSINTSISGFRKQLLNGAVPNNKKIESLLSEVLPGDEVLVIYVPKQKEEDLEAYEDVFDDCEMFFSKDKSSYREVNEISMMNKEELINYIKNAISLCGDCLAHKHMYDEILTVKLGIKSKIKDFIGTLLKSKDEEQKIDLSEAIFLKQRFIDRFYIAGSMDIYDYVVRYIKSTIAYVESNKKHL